MKKLFSLLCLFVFMFFGFANIVLASVDPENNKFDALDLKVVAEAYYEWFVENSDTDGETGSADYNVKEVTYDDSKLSVVSNDSDTADFVYLYDTNENSLSYKFEGSYIEAVIYILYINGLSEAITKLHGFGTDDWNAFFELITDGQQEFTYENDGFYFEFEGIDDGEDTVVLNFKISLNDDFPKTLNKVLYNITDDSGNAETPILSTEQSSTIEQTENNPITSGETIGNLVFIGGCLLLITGYGLKRLKKVNKKD